MKTSIYLFVASLLFPAMMSGQWQNLGNGYYLPSTLKTGVSTLSVVDTNVIWTRALLPSAVFSRTVDGGHAWTSGTITSNTNYYTDNLFALNGDTAWYTLSLISNDMNSKIFRTNNGGQSWIQQYGPFNNARHAAKQIYFFDKNVGIAYGNSNTGSNLDSLRIYRTTNGGSSWARVHPTQLPTRLSGEKVATSGLNPNGGNNHFDVKGDTLWFGTTMGRVWRSINQGQSWTAYQVGVSIGCSILSSVQFSNHLNGIAIPCNGTLALRTTNGGQTWTTITIPYPARVIEYIPGTAGSFILAPAYATQPDLSITHDHGTTWETMNISYPMYMFSTVFLSPTLGYGGSFIAGPTNGGVFKWMGDLNAPNPDCSQCAKIIDVFPHAEDFEKDGGDWCESGSDDLNWFINTKTTVTANTGPSSAHQGNYFLFIESSTPNYPSKSADLVSPCYHLKADCNGSASFRFSYHMYGSTMGSLSLAVSTDSGQSWSMPIWSRTGNQGNNWKTDSVNLTTYIGQTIRLRIAGISGSGEFSDIAIDDLVISTGPRLRISATVSDVGCHGDSTGNILAAGINGTPPYAYSWSTGDTGAHVTHLPPGSYHLVVRDSNGCVMEEDYSIQEPPVLMLTTSGTHVSCFGNANGRIQTTASGGTSPYSYLWSTGASTSSISNLPPAKYILIFRDVNNCTIIDSFRIEEPPQLFANPLITHVSCPGDTNGSITLNPSGGVPPYLTSWNTGNLGMTLSSLAPGNYNYFLTDSTSCFVGGTLTIGEPDSVSGDFVVTDVKCHGEANGQIVVTPSGGNGGYTYLWSTGAQTDTVSNLGSGLYSVQITDSLGCSKETSTHVAQPDSLSLTKMVVHDTTGTMKGLIDLTVQGGVLPYTFLWNTGATTKYLFKLPGDSLYTVQITDANGCLISDSTWLEGKVIVGAVGEIDFLPFQLYPNPAGEVLILKFSSPWPTVLTLQVFDLQGRLLLQKNEHLNSQEKMTRLEVSSLASGIYYLSVQTEKGKRVVKWVKN